jgi:hypothetical protein
VDRALPPLLPLLLSLALVACATAPPKPTGPGKLSKRAAFDLNCPARELMATNIDEKTIGVRGCGKRTVYISVCENVRPAGMGLLSEEEECRWIRQGEVQADSARE